MSAHAGVGGVGFAIFAVAGRGGVEDPAAGELAAAPVPGREHRAAVIAAAHDDAGMNAIEIGDARQEAIGTVAIAIIALVAADAAPGGDVAAGWDVIGGGEGCTGAAVEDGEEFRAVENFAIAIDPVGIGVADHFAFAVDGSVGRFAGDFGDAVAVEVIDHELRVVRAFADVFAEVDGPEQGAIEFVGLKNRWIGQAGLRIVAAAAGHVNDDLVFAIAVKIADGGVVGGIALRSFQRSLDVLARGGVGWESEWSAGLRFDAIEDGPNVVSCTFGD